MSETDPQPPDAPVVTSGAFQGPDPRFRTQCTFLLSAQVRMALRTRCVHMRCSMSDFVEAALRGALQEAPVPVRKRRENPVYDRAAHEAAYLALLRCWPQWEGKGQEVGLGELVRMGQSVPEIAAALRGLCGVSEPGVGTLGATLRWWRGKWRERLAVQRVGRGRWCAVAREAW